MKRKPFHFLLLTQEDQDNLQFLMQYYFKTTGMVISKAEILRKLMRQEVAILKKSSL